MARTKLTADNHCHTPIKGGEKVENMIAAAMMGRSACLDHLDGAHPDEVCSDNGITALHALVRRGSGNAREQLAMDVLLDLGANVEAVNLRGQTPVMCAAHAGSWWAVEKLCAAGARLDVVDKRGQDVASLMRGWIARHAGREGEARSLLARLSSAMMHDEVAHPSTPRKPAQPRL